MTLCELVTLDAILKPNYGNFLRNAHSHREAGFLFMEWLGCLKKIQLPPLVAKYNPDFVKLLSEGLLVCDAEKRKSCAQVLDLDFLKGPAISTESTEMTKDTEVTRQHPVRREDDSTLAPLHKGTLWKLNFNGNPKDKEHWIKRDMWIGHNHSLCYYSQKEGKKLVLIDCQRLASAMMTKSPEGSTFREFAFEVSVDDDNEGRVQLGFAAESSEEMDEWMKFLKQAGRMNLLVTMKLGAQMEADLKEFRLNVRNRRMKILDSDHDAYGQQSAAVKNKLWKLKSEGDKMQPDDWFQREFWIAKNNCMVYFSPKENRELVYYTAADFLRAETKAIPSSESHYPFTFQVILKPCDGVEFAPGEFACETEEIRKEWMAKIAALGTSNKL
jgi:hypothetical protein